MPYSPLCVTQDFRNGKLLFDWLCAWKSTLIFQSALYLSFSLGYFSRIFASFFLSSSVGLSILLSLLMFIQSPHSSSRHESPLVFVRKVWNTHIIPALFFLASEKFCRKCGHISVISVKFSLYYGNNYTLYICRRVFWAQLIKRLMILSFLLRSLVMIPISR